MHPSLRMLGYSISRVPPFRLPTHGYYAWAAKKCALTFSKRDGVSKVLLRGGYLSHLRPGISDIDLSLFVDEGVTSLQDIYTRLKKRTLVLGEVEIWTENSWRRLRSASPAILARYKTQAEWEGSRWVPRSESFCRPTNASRLQQCFENYISAQHYLRKTPQSRYYEIVFKKEMRKFFQFADYPWEEDASYSTLLAKAFLTLRSLSLNVRQELQSSARVQLRAADEADNIAGRLVNERIAQDLNCSKLIPSDYLGVFFAYSTLRLQELFETMQSKPTLFADPILAPEEMAPIFPVVALRQQSFPSAFATSATSTRELVSKEMTLAEVMTNLLLDTHFILGGALYWSDDVFSRTAKRISDHLSLLGKKITSPISREFASLIDLHAEIFDS